MMMLMTNVVRLLLLIQGAALVFSYESQLNPTCLTTEITLEKYEKWANNMSLPFVAVELYAPWQPDARTLCRLHDELAVEPGLGLPIGLVNCAKEEKLCANFHILRFPCFFLGGLKMEPNGVIHRDWVPYFGRREVGDLIYAFQRKYPDFSVPVDMNVINRFAHDKDDTHPKVMFFNRVDDKLTLAQRITFEFFGKLTFYHALKNNMDHDSLFERFNPVAVPTVIILKKNSELEPGAFEVVTYSGPFDHASLTAFLNMIVSEILTAMIPPADNSEEVPASKGSEKVPASKGSEKV